MQRERITDNILVFRSDLYAQVTAGVVLTSAGAVMIDTLLYPEESQRIRRYVEFGLGYEIVYVINTHFHADHSTGTCFFPGAQVIGHRLCRDLLHTRGRDSLQDMKEESPEFGAVKLVLPNIVFDDELSLGLGDTTIRMWSSPGHSPDSIVCLVEEEGILFAADTVMPIPFFVDGDFEDFKRSLQRLRQASFENIVQGHGDIILRGEAENEVASDLAYLDLLEKAVAESIDMDAAEAVERITAEACGKNEVLLNGLVRDLHQQNVRTLLERRQQYSK